MEVISVIQREEESRGWTNKVVMLIASLAIVLSAVSIQSQQADALTSSRRWYGMDVQLNKRETNLLTAGSAGAAAIAVLIPDPTLAKIFAVTAGVYAGYASWVQSSGGCLKFRVTYTRQVIPAHYYGWPCV